MSLMLTRSAGGRSAAVGQMVRAFLPAACRPSLLSARSHSSPLLALFRPQSTTSTVSASAAAQSSAQLRSSDSTAPLSASVCCFSAPQGEGGDRAAASFANTSDVESRGPRGSPTSPMPPPPPPPPPPSPPQPQSSTSTPSSSSPPAASSAAPAARRPRDYSRRVDTVGKDVVTCCRLEHRLLDWLYLERFRPNVDGDRQQLQEAAYNIVKLLSLHFFCEEFAVYPTVLREAPNGQAMVQELMKEHLLLRGALYKLDELLTVEDDGFCSYVCWMCDRHAQHADKEEKEVLSWLEAHKTPAELLELGRWYNIARNIGPTRPHPELSHQLPMHAPERQLAAKQDAEKDSERFERQEEEGGGQQQRPPAAR